MRRILFLLILFLSFPTYANDYFQWYWGTNQANLYPSAVSACAASPIPDQGPSWKDVAHAGVRLDFPNSGFCLIKRTRVSDDYEDISSTYRVTRIGSECEEGKTYNPQTGECEQDCSDTIGQNLLVRGPNSPVFNSNGKNYVLASANDVDGTCTSSCRYDSISSFAGSCYLVAGSTDTGYCNYIVTGTGDSCSTHNLTPGDMSGDPLNSPDPGDGGGDGGDPDEPDQPDPCHGVPGYTWNGSTCVNTGGGDGDGDGDGSGDGDGGGGGPGGPGDGGGNNGGGDGGGDGNGDGGGPGGGGGNGGDGDGDCEGEDCGPGAGQPGLAEFGEDVGGFGDSLDGFMDRISESPLLESLNSIGSSTPQGNCSIATVRVWFFDFDAGAIFCDMAPGLVAPLYPLFLAIWAFAAVRILFSA